MNEVPPRVRITPWIVVAGVLVVVYVAVVLIFLNSPPEVGSTLYRLTGGFNGNLTSGVLVSILFLLIALHTDAQTESKIERIRNIVETEDYRRENDRKIAEFERFLKEDPYYDVRFPNLTPGTQTLGLCYKIEPVRDQNGKPVKRMMPFDSYYVVRVVGPAHEEVMSEDTLLDYEMSSICDDEYYYCRFFNGDWHMGMTDGMMHRFYLSGWVSPVMHGQTANDFMKASALPEGFQVFQRFYVLISGEEQTGTGGCDQWELVKDSSGHPYVRSYDSRPKRVYKTTEEITFNSKTYFTVIENIRGHFGGDALQNFERLVEKKCAEHGVTIPQYEWHQVN